MRITPLDIRKQPFRKTLMGFDPDAVNSFLEMVAGEFENLIRDNSDLATQLKVANEKLEHYIKIEKTMNETLLTVQKATDEARINAQKESELIIKDAKARADRYEDEARQRSHELESDMVALKNQRDSFLARFKSMLKTQLEIVSTISDELHGTEQSGNKEALTVEVEDRDQPSAQSELSSMDVIGDSV